MATDLRQGLLNNVIHSGIRTGKDIALVNVCFGSAVILILSVIDTRIFLGFVGSCVPGAGPECDSIPAAR